MNKITSVAKLSKEFILELFNLTKIVKEDWPELGAQEKQFALFFGSQALEQSYLLNMLQKSLALMLLISLPHTPQ